MERMAPLHYNQKGGTNMRFVPMYCIQRIGERLGTDTRYGMGFYKVSKTFLKKIGIKTKRITKEQHDLACNMLSIMWRWRSMVKEYVEDPSVVKALSFCTDQLAYHKTLAAMRCNRPYCPWCTNISVVKLQKLIKLHNPIGAFRRHYQKGLSATGLRSLHRLFVARSVCLPPEGVIPHPGKLIIEEVHFLDDTHNIDTGTRSIKDRSEIRGILNHSFLYNPDLLLGPHQHEYLDKLRNLRRVTVMDKYIEKKQKLIENEAAPNIPNIPYELL